MSKKCPTAQRFIRTEMTTYRIGTLARPAQAKIQMLTTSSWIVTILLKWSLLKSFIADLNSEKGIVT